MFFPKPKGRGFRFEETHLNKLERIDKLMVLLAVGFCWAHKIGEWRAIKKPIIFNKHKESQRPQYSYFRYGFDIIRDVIFNMPKRAKEFQEFISKLVLPLPYEVSI